jgi:hypothetical protein
MSTEVPDPNPAGPKPHIRSDIGTHPGDMFSWIIKKITGESPCWRCQERIQQMNKWGWMECWRQQQVIIGWLVDEARRRGHVITYKVATDMLLAAWKEYRQNRQHRSD